MKKQLTILAILIAVSLSNTGCTSQVHKEVAQLMAKAQQGDARAQSNLGVRYANGDGVFQDYAEAIQII